MNNNIQQNTKKRCCPWITENGQSVNTENATECEFGNAIRELSVSSLLKKSSIRKKKGGGIFDIFQFLLLPVFQNCNLYHFLNSKKQDTAFSKNTYYRFLNESEYNRKRFLALLAIRAINYFSSLTKLKPFISLVLDDSVVPSKQSKKVELLSRVYDHVKGRTVKGFNMLTFGWTDNYSFVPVAFNMMVSAVKMLHDALAAGIQATYALMDTWFMNKPFIKKMLDDGIDVIGMPKGNRQHYYKGRLY